MLLNEKETHPSFGKIQINRFYGGQTTYFGSNIQHNGGISITIKHASLERSLHHDWILSGDDIIEIRMSKAQFAELITAMDTDGVACTIFNHNGKQIESPPFTNKRLEFQEEFSEKSKKQAKQLDDLKNRIDELSVKKGQVNKSEINEVKAIINKIHQDLNSNLPYMSKCFNETMEKTVLECKGEIEGFVEGKIRQVGIEAIKELSNISLLENNEEINVNTIEE